LIGLTSLRIGGQTLMPPKVNRQRALFVLTKIEEILTWEARIERERDTKFVELGRYLCEVRDMLFSIRGAELHAVAFTKDALRLVQPAAVSR